jgi:ABC-type nitrate/sulfonate/bicarbonate transport system substrate-binding protein
MSLVLRAGLRIDEVKTVSHGERGLAGAVESAAVDAAVVRDPWATDLLDSGKVVAVADLRDAEQAARWLGEPTVHAAIFARPDTALGSPELAPLCRALLRAIARIRAASPAELERTLPAAVVGMPEDFAVRLRGGARSLIADGSVSPERLRASVTMIATRRPLPAKVKLPRSLDSLLMLEPLREARR